MRYLLTAAALLATTVLADKRDLCDGAPIDDNGNYYCKSVKAITYKQVGGQGSYNRITDMDAADAQCSSEPQSYSGSLSPLDEEVGHDRTGSTSAV